MTGEPMECRECRAVVAVHDDYMCCHCRLIPWTRTIPEEQTPGTPRSSDDGPNPFADALRTLEQHWYTDEELARWLVAPQPQFDGLTALQMLAAGRKDEVLACVQRLDDGVYV